MRFKKIMVAHDFSTAADLALEAALSLARADGSSVHVLHVVEDPVAAAWSEAYIFELPVVRDSIVEQAERSLAAVVAAHPLVSITTEVVIGRPADAIVETAALRTMDLIVVGSHGRSGLARLFLGSAAERVLRHAPCAVLMVRQMAAVIPAQELSAEAIAVQA
jgi:universal stress protein A